LAELYIQLNDCRYIFAAVQGNILPLISTA